MAKTKLPEGTGEEREGEYRVGPGHPPREHQFQPGNPGRAKGSRNKLGEAFIQALHDDFGKHGVKTIETVRSERPHEYLKVVASLLPKQVEIKEGAFDGVSDEELAALVAAARGALGVAEGGRARAPDKGEPKPPRDLPPLH